jgi:hypothetical protein
MAAPRPPRPAPMMTTYAFLLAVAPRLPGETYIELAGLISMLHLYNLGFNTDHDVTSLYS